MAINLNTNWLGDVPSQLKKLLTPALGAIRGLKKDPAAHALAKPKHDVDLNHPIWQAAEDTLFMLWVCRFGEGWVPYREVFEAGDGFVQIFIRFRVSNLVRVSPEWENTMQEHMVRLHYRERYGD